MPQEMPASTRYIKSTCQQHGIEFEDLDDGSGYLFRVSKDGRSFLGGAGNISAYPINNATSHGIARDKAHTKAILKKIGIQTIPGRLFFSSSRFEKLHPHGTSRSDASLYAQELGFPVFCKPNHGSRGDFAELVDSEVALHEYVDRIAVAYDGFLIEPVITADEYRVFVKDDHAIYSYMKRVPHLIGDGESTLGRLLARKNTQLRGSGISEYLPIAAIVNGFALDDVIQKGETVPLAGRKNLTDQKNIEHFTFDVDATVSAIAVDIVSALGLRVAAVDLFYLPQQPDKWLSIEVNSNPSMTVLEKLGHHSTIEKIWLSIISDALAQ